MFPCRTHTSKGASTRGALRGIWGIYKDEIQALSSSQAPHDHNPSTSRKKKKNKNDPDAEKYIDYKL